MARDRQETGPGAARVVPVIAVSCAWDTGLHGRHRRPLETVLPSYLVAQRWFGGKARRLRRTRIVDAVPVPARRHAVFVTLVRASYAAGPSELYVLPLSYAPGSRAESIFRREPQHVVARVEAKRRGGVVYESIEEGDVARALLDAIARQRELPGRSGALAGLRTGAFARLRGRGRLDPVVLGTEQSNTSFDFGHRLVMKLFRRLEAGTNPDLEVGRFLTERARFAHVPATGGALEYRPRRGGAAVVALVQRFARNEGDAWRFTLEVLGRFFLRVADRPAPPPLPRLPMAGLASRAVPPGLTTAIDDGLDAARLLGRRTAELHLALAGDAGDPAFSPEVSTPAYRRALAQSMTALTARNFALLRRQLPALPLGVRRSAADVAERLDDVAGLARAFATRRATALRTRVHGDYHLGQVLRCAGDFVIIDFEGEPGVPLRVRRAKHSPLKDVAGMIRSFHYAAHHARRDFAGRTNARPRRAWADTWFAWVSAAFLRSYLDAAGGAVFLPHDTSELGHVPAFHLLEKAAYELGYELNHRPDWVWLPLSGILHALDAGRELDDPAPRRGRR